MRLDLSHRKINQLETLGKRVRVVLTGGREYVGIPDCISWLGRADDEDADDECLKFDLDNGETIFFMDEEIVWYTVL